MPKSQGLGVARKSPQLLTRQDLFGELGKGVGEGSWGRELGKGVGVPEMVVSMG